MGAGPFGLGAFGFDGIALIFRMAAFWVAVLGMSFLCVGRQFSDLTHRGQLKLGNAKTLSLLANCVGWLLLVLSVFGDLIAVVQLYYSPHSASHIFEMHECTRDVGNVLDCYLKDFY